MARLLVSNIVRFAFLLLLQGLVINRLNLAGGEILPFVYIFAFLMLPFETPRALLLLIGFAYGLLMDSFTNTLGMHASACVVLGFAQGYLVKFLSPREGYEFGQRPTVQKMGLGWYITYAGILTFIHHGWLFTIEVFRFADFGSTVLRILLSSMATLGLMIIGQYLIFTQRKSAA